MPTNNPHSSLCAARRWWHYPLGLIGILVLSPLWLPCFLLGVLLGFAWAFVKIGLLLGPELAAWLGEVTE